MRTRSWIFTALWGIAGVFIGIDAFITASIIERQKADTIEQGRGQVSGAAAGAETLLNRALLGVDVLLAGLDDAMPIQGQGPSSTWPGEEAQRLLSGVVKRNLIVRDVVLVSEDGAVLASALPATKRLGLKLPASLLKAAFSRPTPTLTMSAASDNFVTAETVFFFARQFHSEGRRRTAAIAIVPESQVAAALSPGGTLGSLSITLERQDGQLVESVPPSGLPASRRVAQQIRPESRDGVARFAVGRIDGSPALVAARTLLHDDLVVAASLPLDLVLAKWEVDRRNIASVGVLLSLVVLLTAAVTHWYLRRLDQARRDIEESKDWLVQALASMRDGLLLCDASGRIVAWNDRYVEFFPWVREIIRPGLDYEEILRFTVEHLIPAEEVDKREAYFRHRLEEHRRGVTSSEYQVGPDLRLHIAETRTHAGGIVSVFRDITSTERELKQARKAASASEEARSQFVAAVSRQVAQPANNVLGMTELLLRSDLPTQSKRYVTWARESASEILATISDLLEMSRSRSGVGEPTLNAFRVAPVIEEGLHLGRTHAAPRGVGFHVRGQETLPVSLWGDARLIRQGVGLVVQAAIESMSDGAVEVLVRHEPLPPNRVVLAVQISGTDRGVGLSGLKQALDEESARHPGVMALETARKIAEAMGGVVRLEEGNGQGAMLLWQIVVDELGPHALEGRPVGAEA